MAGLTEEEKAEFEKVFDKFKKDEDGLVPRTDVSNVIPPVELDPTAEDPEPKTSGTIEENGNINFEEFQSWVISIINDVPMPAEELLFEFKAFGISADGFVKVAQMRQVLVDEMKRLSNKEFDEMMTFLTCYGDGNVNYVNYADYVKLLPKE